MKSQDVKNAVGAVLPHAGTDKMLPALCGVHIRAVDGGMVFEATDRYTLGMYYVDADPDETAGWPEDGVLVNAKDLWAVVKPGTALGRVGFTVEDGWLVVGSETSSTRLALIGSDFPSLHTLVMRTNEGRSSNPYAANAYNPVLLSRFDKVTDEKGKKNGNPLMFIDNGANKPTTVVSLDRRFMGMIVSSCPVAVGEPFDTSVPAWSTTERSLKQ